MIRRYISKKDTGFKNRSIHYASTSIVTPNSDQINNFGAVYKNDQKMSDGTSYMIFDKNVTSLPYRAFYGNLDLISIFDIPGTIDTIYQSVFYNCTNLKTVNISEGVTKLGDTCFSTCKNLEIVTLPNSLIAMGTRVFEICNKLKTLTIGENLRHFGMLDESTATDAYAVLMYCYNLTTVNWNAINCKDFTSGSNSPFSYASMFPDGSVTLSPIKYFNFGNKVQHIPARLCHSQTQLTELILPKTLKSVGDRAFTNCTGLKTIICKATTPPTVGLDFLRYYESTTSTTSKPLPLTTIKVPSESVNAYKTANGWKDFTNIITSI